MAQNLTKHLNSKCTPQTEPIFGKEHLMAQNSAGGYSFKIDQWKLLDRFLLLGVENGTYYISQKDLTKTNVDNLIACIKHDEQKVLKQIVEISTTGRAPKNDPAIFALAMLMVHGSKDVRKDVAKVLPTVCRIGTHLFTFVHYLDTMRSWGRAVRTAVANWYGMDASQLAYQLVKYQGRTVEGSKNQWTHRDVLRSAHVKPSSEQHNSLFKYVVKGEVPEFSKFITSYEELKALGDKDIKRSIGIITASKIPHDAWPTELKNHTSVWEAALKDLPLTALIRNLGKLSQIGVLKKGGFDNISAVVYKLQNQEYINKSRVHPLAVLIALKTYAQGQGFRGSLSWSTVPQIIDALNDAFYLSFGNVETTGKRFCLGLDISGSMSSAISGANGILSCAEGTAAMSMITARTEKNYAIMGFSDTFIDLGITANMDLPQALRIVSNRNFGGTDCSLPMMWALKNDLKFDAFCVYTDNETYARSIQPVQALKKYRDKTGIDAKLIVIGMASNGFSIADPTDPGMLDVVGFDTAVPQVISEFVR